MEARRQEARGASAQQDAIRVAVRVRPFSAREMRGGAKCVIAAHGASTVVATDPTAFIDGVQAEEEAELEAWRSTFHFDRCFWSCDDSHDGGAATQADVFEAYGPWIIENAVAGYNCSLFAYGQTGSGKTHTMMGRAADVDDAERGFIPRLCHDLFAQIRQAPAGARYHVEASYFEIYNERVFDLLNAKSKIEASAALRVREHPKTGAYVEDLLTLAVNSYGEIEELLQQGALARHVAETQMNKESSRSHAVFQLMLRTERSGETGRLEEQKSRLYLVDLAGSERVSASGATGARLKEAANINRSLSALSDVIKALTSRSSEGARFVPYRNSALTWLLKESLGGNAKTVMLATLSPDAANYSESLSTLKYAERAKKIVNKARVNKESNALLVESLQQEILELRQQLAQYQDSGAPVEEKKVERRKLLRRLESQEKLVTTLSASWEEKREIAQEHFSGLHEENRQLQEERDRMEREMERLKSEKQILETREMQEERKRLERQQRHKAQLESQKRKRKNDLSKQQELQRQLEAAEQHAGALELQLEEAQRTNEALEQRLAECDYDINDLSSQLERTEAEHRKRLEGQDAWIRRMHAVVSATKPDLPEAGEGPAAATGAEDAEPPLSAASEEEEKGHHGEAPELPAISAMTASLETFIQVASEQAAKPPAPPPPSREQQEQQREAAKELRVLSGKYEAATKQLASFATQKERMELAIAGLHESLEASEAQAKLAGRLEDLLRSNNDGPALGVFVETLEKLEERQPGSGARLGSFEETLLALDEAHQALAQKDAANEAALAAAAEKHERALAAAKDEAEQATAAHSATVEQLAQAQAAASVSQAKISALQEQVTQLDGELRAACEAAATAAAAAADASRQQIAELEAQLASANAATAAAEKARETSESEALAAAEALRAQLDRVAAREQAAVEELTKAQSAASGAEARLSELEAERDAAQAKLMRVTDSEEQANEELRKLRVALEESNTRADSHEAARAALSDDLDAAQRKVLEATKRGDAAEAALGEARNSLEEAKARAQELESRAATAETSLKGARKGLQASIERDESARSALAALQVELSESAARITELERAERERGAQLESLRESLAAAKQSCEAAESRASAAAQRYEKEAEQAAQAAAEKEDVARKQLASAAQELATLRSVCAEREDALAAAEEAAEAQARDLRRQLEEAQRRVAAAEATGATVRSEQTDKIRRLASESSALQGEVRSLQAAQVSLREQLQDSVELAERMRTKLENASTELKHAEESSSRMKRERDAAREELEKKSAHLERLASDLGALEGSIDGALSEKAALLATVAKLKQEKQAAERASQSEVEELRLDVAALRQKLSSAGRTIRGLEASAAAAGVGHGEECAALRSKVAQGEADKANTMQEMAELTRECEARRYAEMDACKSLSEAKLEVIALKEQLQVAKEREAAFDERLRLGSKEQHREIADLRKTLAQQTERAEREAEELRANLEEARKEAYSLSQQVQNERKAFDQIFKAQAEVLSYSQFPREGRRQRRRSSAVLHAAGLGQDAPHMLSRTATEGDMASEASTASASSPGGTMSRRDRTQSSSDVVRLRQNGLPTRSPPSSPLGRGPRSGVRRKSSATVL